MKRPLLGIFAFMILFSITPAFAEVTIEAVYGSGVPGCEETLQGCYTPNMAIVDIGDTVTMVNIDTTAHTFTSGDPTMPETIGVLFDSSLLMTGSSFEWSPTEAGEVDYFCMVHPWMTGLLIVGSIDEFNFEFNTIQESTNENPETTRQLEKEIIDLKLENRNLKNQIQILQDEIEQLEDIIVNALKEIYAWVP